MRQWGASRAVFTRRARLSGRTCDFEFQRPHPATPVELFGRTVLAVPLFPDHHMLDVRIELTLSFARCFSIDWNFDQGRAWRVFFGGSRVGTRFLSGVVLELFSRRSLEREEN